MQTKQVGTYSEIEMFGIKLQLLKHLKFAKKITFTHISIQIYTFTL